MTKVYTNEDTTFTGENTFEKGFNVDSNKIVNLQTPSDDTDGSNKLYVDALFTTIKSATVAAIETTSTSVANIATASVTVASGDKVLLLANGTIYGSETTEPDAEVWFRRGTTDLTNDDASAQIISDNDLSAQHFSMTYLDTSPGTGTVTYYVRGYGEDALYGRFTVIVFN